MPPDDPRGVPRQTYGNWPGIEEPGQIHVSQTRLKAIAKRLQAHLEDLLAADEHLQLPPKAAFGQWDAAQAFFPSVQAGHEALADQHSRVLHSLMDMIKKLHRAAHMYDAAEADLERRIAAVDKRLHVQPSSSLAGHDPSPARHAPGTAVPNSLNPDARD